MSEIFRDIPASGDAISVTFTELDEEIAEKAEENRNTLQGPKDDERIVKNDPSTDMK